VPKPPSSDHSTPVGEAVSPTEPQDEAGANIGAPNIQPNITEVVLLIHGIRDFAEWQDMVATVLAEMPNIEVCPLNMDASMPFDSGFLSGYEMLR
jgi:hypothetical protein